MEITSRGTPPVPNKARWNIWCLEHMATFSVRYFTEHYLHTAYVYFMLHPQNLAGPLVECWPVHNKATKNMSRDYKLWVIYRAMKFMRGLSIIWWYPNPAYHHDMLLIASIGRFLYRINHDWPNFKLLSFPRNFTGCLQELNILSLIKSPLTGC